MERGRIATSIKDLKLYHFYVNHTLIRDSLLVYIGYNEEYVYFYEILDMVLLYINNSCEERKFIQAYVNKLFKEESLNLNRLKRFNRRNSSHDVDLSAISIVEIKVKNIKMPNIKQWYLKNRIVNKEIPTIIME